MRQSFGKAHLEFVDWMKVIGMYAIILGHFAPPNLQSLVYSFSVQLFFFISGFLFHREDDNEKFWRKNMRSLVIPYFIWGVFRLMTYNLKCLDFTILQHSIVGLFLGCNNFMGIRGCGELWFVATLLFLKIILQYGRSMKFAYFFLVVSLFATVLYRNLIENTDYEYMGIALGNVFVAYPFFCLGYLIARLYKHQVIQLALCCDKSPMVSALLVVLAMITMWYVTNINGVVLMVYGQYGNSFVLYLLFGVIGIVLVFLLAMILKHLFMSGFAYNINVGSVMILGLHTMVITLLKPILVKCCGRIPYALDLSMALASLVILCMFVPIIKMTIKYAPIALGSRGKIKDIKNYFPENF